MSGWSLQRNNASYVQCPENSAPENQACVACGSKQYAPEGSIECHDCSTAPCKDVSTYRDDSTCGVDGSDSQCLDCATPYDNFICDTGYRLYDAYVAYEQEQEG